MDNQNPVMDVSKTAFNILKNPGKSIGDYLTHQYVYNNESKRIFPSSPYWKFSEASSIKDPKKRTMALGDAGLDMMIGATNSPIKGSYIPDEEAQLIPALAHKMNSLGNISIEDTGKVMDIASKYLKIPKPIFNKMSTSQILSELGGLLNKNQHYVYGTLKGY